ncbi:hypothetical protein V5799_029145 [Amblyomma americanum]|uniref:Alpha-amylase n=1 Tax=Amblyomma americanum TaxID=6943 RepID=A0AAQ4ERV6_AMBAM
MCALPRSPFVRRQVSPPSENAVLLYKTPGGVSVRSWYERYEPVSYKIVSPSGDMEEFADMVRRCNESQVRVFVDVVLNHMTSSIGEGFGYGGTPFSSDNFAYDGVPYRASDFHSRAECGTVSGLVEDYTNVVQVRNCKFRDRADLNHKLESVRSKIVDYLKRLLSVGVSGFRIDGADYMWPEDLEVIYDRLKGADGAETETASEGFSEAPAQAPEEAVAMTEGGTPSDTQASTVQDATLVKDRETATPAWTASQSEDPFMYHEMSTLNLRWTKEYARIGAVTSATFFKTYANALNQAQESTLKTLRPFIMGDVALSPVQVVYVDSHETQRGVDVADAVADVVSHRDRKRHVLATVLMLAQPHGIARVMSSYALDRKFDTYVPPKMLGAPFDHMFNTLPVLMKENYECYNGWICEHRWLPIRNMIRFRNGVADAPATNWWDDDADAVAFARLRRGFVLVNNGRSVVRGLSAWTLPPRSPPSPYRLRRESFRTTSSGRCASLPSNHSVSDLHCGIKMTGFDRRPCTWPSQHIPRVPSAGDQKLSCTDTHKARTHAFKRKKLGAAPFAVSTSRCLCPQNKRALGHPENTSLTRAFLRSFVCVCVRLKNRGRFQTSGRTGRLALCLFAKFA